VTAVQIFLWDVASGRFIRKLRGHDSTINAVGDYVQA
jgi:mitogen-activated protein kinase organizer 1